MKFIMNWTLIRIVMIVSGTSIGALGLVLGYLLIRQGAMGEFKIFGEAKGIKVFITSVSPGVFLAIVAGIVNAIALWIQKECLGMPREGQLKERGGAEYYKVTSPNQ